MRDPSVNKIFESDPFAKLDQVGVGKLVKIAIDLGKTTRHAVIPRLDGSLNDRSGLHLSYLGIGDAETATSVTHHRVGLVQSRDSRLELLYGDIHYRSYHQRRGYRRLRKNHELGGRVPRFAGQD